MTKLNSKNESLTQLNKLKNCSVKIVSGCFFKCKMCHFWKKEKKDTITFDMYKKVILDLKKINPSIQISLYGGEPLMRNDIYDFIKFAYDNGLETNLCTNGFLINNKVSKKLSDSGLYHMYLSIDGYTKKTHDSIRGINGSYEKIINAIKINSNNKKKFFTSLTFVIMKDNLHEVVDFLNWSDGLDEIKEVSLQVLEQPHFTRSIDYWYRDEKYKFLWPDDPILIKKVFRNLIKKKKGKKTKLKQTPTQLKHYESYYLYPEVFIKNNTSCNVKDEYLNIYDDGGVYSCNKLDPIGNIHKNRIYDIWYSKKADNVRTQMSSCKSNCLLVLTSAYSDN